MTAVTPPPTESEQALPKFQRYCKACGKSLGQNVSLKRKYCNPACRQKASRMRNKQKQEA